MIISTTHNFILFKAFKTASTSVLHALGAGMDPIDPTKDYVYSAGLLEGYPEVPNTQHGGAVSICGVPNPVNGPAHKKPQEVLDDEFGGDWDTYLSFERWVIVRNPFDYIVSAFFYTTFTLRSVSPTLEHFVLNRETNGWDWGQNAMFWDPQYVSHYLRYEVLQDDYFSFCKQRGINAYILPTLKARTRPKEWREVSRDIFNDKMLCAIYDVYGYIIKEFGYEI